MARRILPHILFVAGILAAPSASAQPFGISMGTQQASFLITERDIQPGLHEVSSVPRPHSEFVKYFIVAGYEAGVCAIRAKGKFYSNDTEGKAVKAAFQTVKSQLDSAYGLSRTDYYIKPESDLGEDQLWVKSIAEYDRIHRAIWDLKSDAEMKNDVVAIALLVQAYASSEEAYLSLEYRFSNYEDCQKEITNSDVNAL
jgi:hypothetical protein